MTHASGALQRERVKFGRTPAIMPIPNLIEMQRHSYQRFLDEGLMAAFREVAPISDYTGNLLMEVIGYRLGEPKYDLQSARERHATYAAPLLVQVRLVNRETGEVKEQEVYMGDLPLMTPDGTFVINGVERVIIAQLVRSPGVFYSSTTGESEDAAFGATLIPNRGAWLEFETDPSGAIWARVDRTRRIPATVLLRALGLGDATAIESAVGSSDLLAATLAKDTTTSEEESLVELYRRLRPGEPPSPEQGRQLLETLLFDPRRYDLAAVGRYKLNKKLALTPRIVGETAAETIHHPETDEVLVAAGALIDRGSAERIEQCGIDRVALRLRGGQTVTVVSNGRPAPDVRTVTRDDIIAAINYLITLSAGIGSIDDVDHLGNRRIKTVGELLHNQVRAGLMRMERIISERMTIQDADTLTPQGLINIRPLVTAIREFFGSSQLSQFMDQTNPLSSLSHKRRLSAIGPGGLSRERAGFQVRDVHHSHYGRICPIESPEGQNIGLIGSMSIYARLNEFGFLETPYRKVDRTTGRVTDEVVFLTADEEEGYVIAQATDLDETGYFAAPRVTCRHKKAIVQKDPGEIDFVDVAPHQAVSVSTALIPFLEHDDASRALMGSNMQRQAVPLLRTEAPIVGTGMEYRAGLDAGVAVIAEHDGVVEEAAGHRIVIRDKDGRAHEYPLTRFSYSNARTCVNQKPIVRTGDHVQVGDIIADGPSTDRGELALGKNVLVAYMCYEGYNFEDAIIVNERLVKEDVFTSIHITEYEAEIRDTKLGPEEITRVLPNVGEAATKDLDERGIIRVGASVGPGDILVGKVTPKTETDMSPEAKLLQAIFGERPQEVKDTSLRLPHGESGIVLDVKVFTRKNGDEMPPGVNEVVRVYIAQKRKISQGDKMAGRHGNKGVVSVVVPEEDMPFLPDGTPIDIILTPLGVPSRMNIGQVMEIHLGLAAKALGLHVATPVFDGAEYTDIQRLLQEAGLPDDGKTVLYSGKTGQPLDQRVTVGYKYMMKLHHLVDDKIHARSTGPYSLVTQQPLGGKAQFGGQRLGEMEVWALEAYGAAYTLQEMLTVKSDDVVGRVKTYEAIITGENVPEPGIPESFRVLISELQSIGLSVTVRDGDGNPMTLFGTGGIAGGVQPADLGPDLPADEESEDSDHFDAEPADELGESD